MKWPCKRNVCAVCKPGGLAFDHFDAIQDLTPLAWASKSPRSEPMVSGLAFNHFDAIQDLTVRSNSNRSSGFESRPGNCPYAPVA